MTQPQELLGPIDRALAHLEHATEDLGQILTTGEQTVTVEGIKHELHALVARLHSLRDDVAARVERNE